MRVCLCVPAYTPADDYGGPVTKIALLAAGLRDRGHEVQVVTVDFGRARTRVPAGTRAVNGVPVTYTRRLAAYGWVALPLGVDAAVRANAPDVVHVFGLRDGLTLMAARTARRLGVPLVVEPMGMAEPRVRHLRLKRSVDRVLRRVYGRAAVTLATSALEAGELEQAGFPNVVTRANPVAARAVGDAGPPRFDVAYVGRLHRKKQLPQLVEVVASIPTVRVVIAGPDEDGTGATVAALVESLGIGDRVELHGWVEPERRDALIAASRCFVLPSLTENFGNAAAEAIALGVPVVVTRACGVAALVEDTGAGIVIDDVSHLRDAIVAVLSGDLAGGTDAREGAARIAELSPSAVSAAQEAIYLQALEAS